VVPLNARGALVGVIVLGERTTAVLRRTSGAGAQHRGLASIAIHNAYLFDMSTTDMMTKLKMRHFFSTVLQNGCRSGPDRDFPLPHHDGHRSVQTGQRHLRPHLRRRGHRPGGGSDQGNVRSEDVAARYGGEEFAVLLSGSETGEACAVAERIRAAVAAARVEGFCAEGCG
jgi:hypothetical protein